MGGSVEEHQPQHWTKMAAKGILVQTLNLSFSLSIRSTNIDIQVPEPLRIFLLVAKLITS